MIVDDPPEQLYFLYLFFLSKQGWQCHHLLPLESTQAAGIFLPSSSRQCCQIGDVLWREAPGFEDEEAAEEKVAKLRSESFRRLLQPEALPERSPIEDMTCDRFAVNAVSHNCGVTRDRV